MIHSYHPNELVGNNASCSTRRAPKNERNNGRLAVGTRSPISAESPISVPTRGLRPLERWLCQCQLAAFGRSNGGFVSANSRPSAARRGDFG
ncbi:hypothetical protein Ddc_21173 [Ditylenchus destructor]|nr:hypothetical protein Ddc_21173 [Ditylenchus destructor]